MARINLQDLNGEDTPFLRMLQHCLREQVESAYAAATPHARAVAQQASNYSSANADAEIAQQDEANSRSEGAICVQWVRCGRANCRCTRGELHGPYYYRFWRENGRLRKQYLSLKNPDNVQLIKQALADRETRREERAFRQQEAEWRAEGRIARLTIQEMGGYARYSERTIACIAERIRQRRKSLRAQKRKRKAKGRSNKHTTSTPQS